MVVEIEVLNDFPRFIGVFIAKFAAGGAVNLTLKMKGDMIIENLDLKPVIGAMMMDFLDPSRRKELSKETSNKILPCGYGSCWKTFKPLTACSIKFTQCATPLFSSRKEAPIEYLRIGGRELEMQDQRCQEEAELERLKLAQAGKFEEQRLAQRNPELEMQEKFVSGGNKGIGFEICRQLALKGLDVILTARNESRGIQAVNKLNVSGLSNVVFHQLDIKKSTSIANLANFIETYYKKLDVLMQVIDENVELLNGVIEEPYELAVECLKTNYLLGAKKTTEALVPLLGLSKSPRIVNVTSAYGDLHERDKVFGCFVLPKFMIKGTDQKIGMILLSNLTLEGEILGLTRLKALENELGKGGIEDSEMLEAPRRECIKDFNQADPNLPSNNLEKGTGAQPNAGLKGKEKVEHFGVKLEGTSSKEDTPGKDPIPHSARNLNLQGMHSRYSVPRMQEEDDSGTDNTSEEFTIIT
ncbi:glucose/ribitol dehydrogenase [Tanacetum coccineum]